MKRTKIICTLGPASNNRETLKALMENGMDIARFNFSHGDHEEQKGRVDMIKELREELDMPIAMLLDTKGPEIRTRLLKDGQKVKLEAGKQFVLGIGDFEGDSTKVAITYETLYKDVKPGNRILIDDGLIELEVKAIKGTDIVCDILNGGELGEKKGVNVPYVKVNLPGITEQDIIFSIEQKFDFIAASFVRSAEVIREIRKLLNDNGGKDIGIIAKIENAEGVENIDSIIEASDGIMVARGDLGVEIPASQVPHIQKAIIRKCNEHYTPVITATQMLDSMIRNPRPTRAEVTDVANAVYDGTDAVMLSGETAQGKYPVEALQMMVHIIENTEKHLDYDVLLEKAQEHRKKGISSAIGYSSVATAMNLSAKCIITPSVTGATARVVSKFKPKADIIGVTPYEETLRKMQIYWGVTPVKSIEYNTTEDICNDAIDLVTAKRLVEPGDIVVMTAGIPSPTIKKSRDGVSNMMRIAVVE